MTFKILTLKKYLSYLWRILATGICFLVFYSTGFLVSHVVVPANNLFFKDKNQKQSNMKKITQYWFKTFLAIMKTLGVIQDINILKNFNQTSEPKLFVANHPTLIDAIVILSKFENVTCVVKQELWESPFVGRIVQACGYIPSETALGVYRDVTDRLENGESVLFFPEGTRSPKNGLNEFTRVLGQIATTIDYRIIPIIIHCNYSTLRKDQPWYDVPPEPLEITLVFNPDPNFSIPESCKSSRQRSEKYVRKLENLFRKELKIRRS